MLGFNIYSYDNENRTGGIYPAYNDGRCDDLCIIYHTHVGERQ